MNDLCIDEPSYKVTMNLSSCFQGSFTLTNRPGLNFICANCIEMTKLKFLVACLNNFINFGWTLRCGLLLKLHWKWNDPCRMGAIKSDSIFDFSLLRNFSLQVVTFVEIYVIDHGLSSQKSIFVQIFCLSGCPVNVTDFFFGLFQTSKCF